MLVDQPAQAFLDAIDAIGRQGTLLIPAGRYLIRKQLNINNRVVLRGGPVNDTTQACWCWLDSFCCLPGVHERADAVVGWL